MIRINIGETHQRLEIVKNTSDLSKLLSIVEDNEYSVVKKETLKKIGEIRDKQDILKLLNNDKHYAVKSGLKSAFCIIDQQYLESQLSEDNHYIVSMRALLKLNKKEYYERALDDKREQVRNTAEHMLKDFDPSEKLDDKYIISILSLYIGTTEITEPFF